MWNDPAQIFAWPILAFGSVIPNVRNDPLMIGIGNTSARPDRQRRDISFVDRPRVEGGAPRGRPSTKPELEGTL